MELCEKCGQQSEELIVQPNGQLWCPNCHRGLGREMTDEEYNRLRMMYDRDADFKKVRHRFWALGLQRRYKVLRAMNYLGEGEAVIEKIERFRLYKIKEAGLEGELLEFIEAQEAEILAENEKSDFLAPRVEVAAEPSGRVHAQRVNLKVTPTNPTSPWDLDHGGPWEESQK